MSEILNIVYIHNILEHLFTSIEGKGQTFILINNQLNLNNGTFFLFTFCVVKTCAHKIVFELDEKYGS